MLIVALATVRTRWAAFAGTFAALALGVSVIAVMALVLAAASGGSPHQRPERFGSVPYVIQVDPNMRVRDRYGSIESVPLLAQPDIPPTVIHQLPGAVPDRSFYAQVQGAPATQPTLGHGWSSAAFAPYPLTSGHAPRLNNEVVVAGPAKVGSRVSVVTAGGSRLYTIVGTVRPRTGEQPIFFTDAQAARLSPGVDALATEDASTAARAVALPGAHLRILQGADRHEADPQAVQDDNELNGLTTFLGVAALISAFVAVTVTATAFGLSVAQRRHDLALLRTIGATPKQVMRLVCAEAAIVGAGGSAVGCLLGLVGAPPLARWIARQGLAPSWFMVSFTTGSALALSIAFLVGIVVAVLSVLMTAARAGTIGPAEALREAAVESKPIGRLRLLGGIIALLCGVGALAVVTVIVPSAVTDPKTEVEVLILLIGGTTLLSPILLGPLTRPFRRGTAGMLLRASILTGPRRAAAAIVPVLIAVGLSAAILGTNATANAAASAGVHQQAADADFVVLPAGTPGVTTALVERLRHISGIEETAVTDTNMLAYQPQDSLHLEPPIPIPTPAIGIDRPSSALNLKVSAGSLAALNDHTLAVDASWGKHVGDTIKLWRPNGTPLSLKIIAVLASTSPSGPSLIVDLHNADTTMPDRIYVKTDSSASDAAVLAAARSEHARPVPVSRWEAHLADQQANQTQVGLELLLGVAVIYSLIGIANTFLMSTGGRRPELALLHKTGASRRQIVWFTTAESLVLTVVGLLLSAIVSGIVLGSAYGALSSDIGSTSIVLPWSLIGAILTACVVIAILTTTLPAWFQLRPRRRPSGSIHA